jgi:hypothetical protein
MAANDRESTFTIKAADLSSQQINQVIATVERLIAVQRKQNEAAAEGAVKTSDFNKSMKDLGTGADAVARQITTLQRYAAVVEEVARREEALATMRARRDELASRGDDLSRPEKAELKRLDGDSRSKGQIANAQKGLDSQNAALAKSEEAMKAMGSSAETVGADLSRLRAFAEQLKVTLDETATAQLHLTENQLKAAAAANEEAAAQANLVEWAKSVQSINAEAARVATQANRQAEQAVAQLAAAEEKAVNDQIAAIQRLKREQEDAAKARTKQREADLDAQQRQYNFEQKLLAESLRLADERLAKEKQLAESRRQIEAQRDLTVQAVERLPAISPLGQPAAPVQDFSKVSRELSSLVDPAAAARQTIDGLTASIDKLLNAIESGKRKPQDLNNDLRELGKAGQDLKRLGGLIDTFQAQEAAVRKADEAVKSAESAMGALAAKGQTLTAVDKEYVAEVRAAEAESLRLIEALERENVEYTRQAEVLQRAGVNHKHLDEDIGRLRASAAGMGKVFTEASEAAAGKTGTVFLGLRPYELQNLSYQINDVFTQLASGTPVTQVFAQQGGQVFQLFQTQLLGFLKTLREIPGGLAIAGAGIAAFAVGFAALGRAMEIASAHRLFAADIAASVDGATRSVEGLTAAAKEVEKLGVGIADSLKGVRDLSNIGVPTDKLAATAVLAGQISRAFGKPFADSVKEVGKAFTGSYDAMRTFTSEYKFLTFEEDRQIKSLYDNNRAEEARAVALELTTKRVKEAKDAGLSPLQKATEELHQNWTKLLDTLGADAAWTKLLNFLATTARELNGIATLAGKVGGAFGWLNDWVMNHKGVEAALDAAGNPRRPAQAEGAPADNSKPTSSPAGPEFAALRDKVADEVGLTREAFRRLQESEGKLRDGRWIDAEDAKGNVLPNGGKGAVQLVQSTFDEVKRKYPDQVTGDIHDVESNLRAGALYFRDIAKQVQGDFYDALRGYKQGPGTVTGSQESRDRAMASIDPSRRAANEASARRTAEGFTGSVLASGRTTEESKINTANYQEEQDRAYRARRRSQATAEELDKFERDEIDDAKQKISKQAQEAAKGGATINPANVELNTQREIAHIQEEFRLERQRRDEEGLKFEQGIRQQELEADKTNLDKRRQAVNQHYDELQAEADKRKAANQYPTPSGRTFEQATDAIAGARSFALDKASEDVARAILDDAEKKRNDKFTQLETELRAQQITGAAANARTQALVAETRPVIADAVKRLNDALAKRQGPETAETQLLRSRGETALSTADRPPQVDAIQTAAIARSQKDVSDIVSERESGVKAIVEKEKSGAIGMRDAVSALSKLLDESTPRLRASIERTNAELRTIAAAPNTTPSRRADIQAEIAKNDARLVGQRTEFINQVVEAGLHDAVEERDRLVKERDAKIADILKKPNLAPGEMDRQIQEVARSSNAEIERAKKRLIQLYRDAMTLPNLTPGQRANLQAGVAETEAVQTTGKEQQRQAITGPSGTLTQLEELQQSIKETQAAVKARIRVGGITGEAGEAKIKQAFEDANRAGQPLLQTIDGQIDALEAMGEKKSVIEALRAKVDELRASFQYATDIEKLLIKGLEDSIVNRGIQAFDAVAKAIGTAIVTGGKFKDVLRETGIAFANMAAGILQDIAKIIIKYELLSAVENLLGAKPGSLTGGGGGGGGVGGLGGILSSLFGGGGGALGGAAAGASAFDEAIPLLAVAHTGRIVGDPTGVSREIDLSLFHEAERMHSGGMVGLAAHEVPMILEKNEEVLSKTDPRNRLNAKPDSSSGGGQLGIRNVLAVGDREIASAMNSSHGERVILNILQRNAPTVKKYVG